MKKRELLELLKDVPDDAEVRIDRGGAYDDARSIDEFNESDIGPIVYISSDYPEVEN